MVIHCLIYIFLILTEFSGFVVNILCFCILYKNVQSKHFKLKSSISPASTTAHKINASFFKKASFKYFLKDLDIIKDSIMLSIYFIHLLQCSVYDLHVFLLNNVTLSQFYIPVTIFLLITFQPLSLGTLSWQLDHQIYPALLLTCLHFIHFPQHIHQQATVHCLYLELSKLHKKKNNLSKRWPNRSECKSKKKAVLSSS